MIQEFSVRHRYSDEPEVIFTDLTTAIRHVNEKQNYGDYRLFERSVSAWMEVE